MQGYIASDGKRWIYINGLPIDDKNDFISEEDRKHLPQSLVMPDGGGMLFWQAYINVDEGTVEILFNDSY